MKRYEITYRRGLSLDKPLGTTVLAANSFDEAETLFRAANAKAGRQRLLVDVIEHEAGDYVFRCLTCGDDSDTDCRDCEQFQDNRK